MNSCAWCDRESGRGTIAGTSHTICAKHAARLVREARKEAALEAEMEGAERRVRARFASWRLAERVTKGRPLPVRWSPAGGKRLDQVLFSAGVLLVAIGAGVVFGAWVAFWGGAR